MEAIDVSNLVSLAEMFLNAVSSNLDSHTSHKGKVITDSNSATLLTPSHIQFAVYGRGPGKKPPFESILKFVKEENIRFDNTTERGTAFAIQASIGKKGTIGYTPNAPNALEEELTKESKKYFSKVAELIKIETRQIVVTDLQTFECITPFKF